MLCSAASSLPSRVHPAASTGAECNRVPPVCEPFIPAPDRLKVRRQKRVDKRKKKPPLTDVERIRLMNQARAIACSDPWAWFVRLEADEQGVNSRSLRAAAKQIREYDIYPIPAENTPMKACYCEQCRGDRFWPPNCVGNGGISYDCYLAKLEMSQEYDDDGMAEDRQARSGASSSRIDLGKMKRDARMGRQYKGGF